MFQLNLLEKNLRNKRIACKMSTWSFDVFSQSESKKKKRTKWFIIIGRLVILIQSRHLKNFTSLRCCFPFVHFIWPKGSIHKITQFRFVTLNSTNKTKSKQKTLQANIYVIDLRIYERQFDNSFPYHSKSRHENRTGRQQFVEK